MRRNSFLYVVTIFTFALILFGCTDKKETATTEVQPVETEKETESIYAVNTYEAYEGDLSAYLEFGGDVATAASVDILPDATGKVTKFFVAVGDYVKKDQAIAEVDPSRPGMTYVASVVKAPISGTITALPISIGSTVSTAMSIGKISSTSTLEINMNVAERFVSKIKMYQTAYLAFDAYPGENFTASVTRISPVLDTSTRTMGVTLKLKKADSRIKPGMYARIKLITDTRKSAVIVPTEAVITRSDEPFIFVVNDGAVTLQSVKQGIKVDDKIEIVSGLEAGAEVVIKGQTLLDNGTKVKVISKGSVK